MLGDLDFDLLQGAGLSSQEVRQVIVSYVKAADLQLPANKSKVQYDFVILNNTIPIPKIILALVFLHTDFLRQNRETAIFCKKYRPN